MRYGFAFSAIALWSSNAIVASLALADLVIQQVLLLQFVGASVVLFVVKVTSQEKQAKNFSLPAALLGIVGLTGTVSFQYIAFNVGPITQTNVVGYAWPLLVASAAIVAGRATRPLLLFACALAGFFGVALVMGTSSIDMFHWTRAGAGFLAAMASAVCMAFYTIVIGRLQTSPINALLPGALVGAILMAILNIGEPVAWSCSILLGLYLGIGPMGLGYYLWSCAMQSDTRGSLALMGYLTPVFSTLLLLIFLGDPVEHLAFVGIAIVLASSFLIGRYTLAEEKIDAA